MKSRHRSRSPAESKRSEKDHHYHNESSSDDARKDKRDKNRDQDKKDRHRKDRDRESRSRREDKNIMDSDFQNEEKGARQSDRHDRKYHSKRTSYYREGEGRRHKDYDDRSRKEDKYERDKYRSDRSSRGDDRYESRKKSHRKEERRKDGWNYFGYTEKDIETDQSEAKAVTKDEIDLKLEGGRGVRSKNVTRVQGEDRRRHETETAASSSKEFKSSKADVQDVEDDTMKGLFDWKSHMPELDRLFFKDDDAVIKKGTQEYHDFWAFFERYKAFQSKNSITGDDMEEKSKDEQSSLGLPTRYDKRYRINISLVTTKGTLGDYFSCQAIKSKAKHKTKERDDELTLERVKEFRLAVMYYLDFSQKQQFSKLAKLRKDQINLPIYKYKDMITDAVRNHQVVIVAGDTGCGKSTQVPQYLLAAGFTGIACTQPRRIACISLAKRVGYETLHEYGMEVGYQIRFEASKSKATKILFLTEGLLLRQLTSDPLLSQYNVIVIDEVHERHLYGDFLLGILRCLLQERQDLKLVLMSATINIGLFSGYFSDAPVIQVPGRLYPIKLEYVPIADTEQSSRSEKLDPRPYLRIMQRIDHKYPSTERGDLLIFMSGMSEITSVAESAKLFAAQTKGWIVLPLHSALSIAEQDKVFDIAPDGVRKCIVSTNIAETSVTIDGVRFIADSGKVKEMSYNSTAKMQQLQEFWISRASAEQRKGRAGRTGPGVCFRLYNESDYDEFQEYSTPEIHRVPLDTLILQMLALGLKDPRKFPFIEPPPMSSIENSVTFLKEQGAITVDETLTPIGMMLSRLPVDVVIGKMLIMGTIFQMIEPVLCIAAALSVQSPFTAKAHRDHEAMLARRYLESDHGDPFTLLNAYDEWIHVKASGQSNSRKWCKKRGLEQQRFYEMSKLKQQFKELLRDHNLLGQLTAKQQQYSSVQRQKRHKERYRLKELKRKQQNATKRRKVLKLEEEDYEVSDPDDEEDDGIAIADIEFKLSHDLNQMQTAANLNRSFTLREINLLKVILCSGLYPQLAIADDCNSYRRDSDQVFHTKAKQFVLLHPTGMFSTNPDALKPPQGDDDHSSKGVMSSRHQLLAYVSLLETNKPYLVNTMRVPALQTVMLYARSLDTNEDCTRIVADGWLELQFGSTEEAEQLVSAVLQLRAAWDKLMQMRLNDSMYERSQDNEVFDTPASLRTVKQERLLASKLAELLDSHIEYSIKMLAATELQHLYIGPVSGGGSDTASKGLDSFFTSHSKDSKPHPTKGGTQVNEYFTYGCLHSVETSLADYSGVMRRHWTCEQCQQTMVVTTLERLQHEAQCVENKDDDPGDIKQAETSKSSSIEALKKSYFCPDCQQDFSFTSTEILKHKRTHKVPPS